MRQGAVVREHPVQEQDPGDAGGQQPEADERLRRAEEAEQAAGRHDVPVAEARQVDQREIERVPEIAAASDHAGAAGGEARPGSGATASARSRAITSAPQTAITPMNASGPARESAGWLPRAQRAHPAPDPPDHRLAHDAAAVRVEQRVEHVAERDRDEERAPRGAHRSRHSARRCLCLGRGRGCDPHDGAQVR